MSRAAILAFGCFLLWNLHADPSRGASASTIAQRTTGLLACGWASQFGTGNPRNPGNNDQPLAFPAGTAAADEVEEFWKTLQVVEQDMLRRQLPAPRRTSPAGDIAWTVDRAAVNFLLQLDENSRYLALRLAVGNRTNAPLEISGASISAEIDGVTQRLQPLTGRLLTHGFVHQDVPHRLEACQPPESLQIPAGGIASAWLIFPGLPPQTTVPPTKLTFELQGDEVTLDVYAHQRAILQLETERLGPQQGLGLVTIGGPMNTFNLQTLVDEMDELVRQQVIRGVLRWKPSAPQPDGQIAGWLQHTVSNAGTGRFTSEHLPTLSVQMRELHLVQPPQGHLSDPNAYTQPGAAPRFHATDAEAVAAALRTTYFTVAPEELRRQILQGHPLSRAAALIYGSNRLSPADLNLVLPLTSDDSPIIRLAALRALREFGEAPALDRLEAAVRANHDVESQTAVASLADSRFAASRERLRELLEQSDPPLQSRIITQLAARPRPAWGDALLAHANDPTGRLRMDVVRVLVQLDHPRVVDLLEEGLRGEDPAIRDFVFPILARRGDERSFQLAANSVLERLPLGPPDAAMLEFLVRSRDRRALPALISKLDRPGERAAIINVLGQMGDRETGDRLAAEFDKFEAHEQVAAINALRLLRHPRFLEIAAQGLVSPHFTVIHNSISALVQEGSPAAVDQLCQALLTTKRDQVLPNLAMALVTLGTPAARDGLLAARQSDHPPRKAAGVSGLENLRNNSPAHNYLLQAAVFYEQQQWKEAAELYRVASELDPFLPNGFSGMGDVALKQEKWSDAAAAFEQAIKLSANDGNTICGLAIALVMLDRGDEALKLIAAARPRYVKDPVFLYNTACVYGRGLERLVAQPATPERDARIIEFRRQALAELKLSVQLGFNQFEWMQRDPDLKSLHGEPEFQQLSKAAPQPE